MAIRDGNTPPRSPGSITQTADSQMDRIGNISNVSKTVSNMQKDVKQRITETKRMVDDSKEISAVQSSMVKVLEKLGDTVSALSSGVKTVTIDTAKATKDAIADYGKAISADISFNKQNVVAMALAKSTPIYGYFVAKFMETDVFKRAAERMKQSIGSAFGSLAKVFRRGGKPEKDIPIPKELRGKRIPHMAKGGVVGKGGMAKLHAAEVVMPIEKILSRIDESNDATKNFGKIVTKFALQHAASTKAVQSMIQHPDEVGGKRKIGLFRDFIRILREEKEREKDSIEVRQLRELIAIRESFGNELKIWPEVWSRLLSNHPMFRNVIALSKSYMSLLGLTTWKPVYAMFRSRGGHARYLSKKHQPLEAMNQNIGLLYVESMWRFDNMLNLLKAIAIATRDTASKITGKKYGALKGVGTGEWSIAGVTARAVGLIAGGAMRLAGKIPGLGFLGRTGRGLMDASLQGHGSKKYSLGSAFSESSQRALVKKDPIRVIAENSIDQTKIFKKVNKSLKDKKWVQWLIMGWGFLKGIITKFWNQTLGKFLNRKVISGLLSSAGGFVSGGFKLPAGMGPKLAGAGGIAAGVAMGVYEAMQAVKLSEKWGTSKTAAGIGGFLGGTGVGVEGAMLGAGKGGMIGAGVGMFFGPIGAAIGGGIGALAGGILGFVGGKRIAKGMDFLGKHIKKAVKAVWSIITIPFTYIKEIYAKFKESGLWKTISGLTTQYIEIVKDQFHKFISIITWPFRKLWELNMKVRDWVFGKIGDVWDRVKTELGKVFNVDNAIAIVTGVLKWPFKVLKWVGSGVASVAKAFIGKENIQKITDIISHPMDSIIGVFSWIGNLFIKIKDKIVSGISSIPGAGWFMDKEDKKGPKEAPKTKSPGWWETTKNFWGGSKAKDVATQAKTGASKALTTATATGSSILSKLNPKARKAFETAKQYYIKEFGWTETQANAVLETIATTAGDKIDMFDSEKLKTTGMNLFNQSSKAVGGIKDKLASMMIEKGQIAITQANLMLANGEMIADDLGRKIVESSKDLGDKTMNGARVVASSVNTMSTNVINNTTNAVNNSGFANSAVTYFDNLVYTGNYR